MSLKNMLYMPRTNRKKKKSNQTSSAGDEGGDEGGDPLLLLLVCRVVCLQACGEQLLQQHWPPEVKLWHFPPCGQLQCSLDLASASHPGQGSSPVKFCSRVRFDPSVLLRSLAASRATTATSWLGLAIRPWKKPWNLNSRLASRLATPTVSTSSTR